MASQDQAVAADRRRVGSINRNWTNYKADVLLYGGGRTVSGECRWYFHYLSLCAQVLCCLKAVFRRPRLSESLAPLPHHHWFLNFFVTTFLVNHGEYSFLFPVISCRRLSHVNRSQLHDCLQVSIVRLNL